MNLNVEWGIMVARRKLYYRFARNQMTAEEEEGAAREMDA